MPSSENRDRLTAVLALPTMPPPANGLGTRLPSPDCPRQTEAASMQSGSFDRVSEATLPHRAFAQGNTRNPVSKGNELFAPAFCRPVRGGAVIDSGAATRRRRYLDLGTFPSPQPTMTFRLSLAGSTICSLVSPLEDRGLLTTEPWRANFPPTQGLTQKAEGTDGPAFFVESQVPATGCDHRLVSPVCLRFEPVDVPPAGRTPKTAPKTPKSRLSLSRVMTPTSGSLLEPE